MGKGHFPYTCPFERQGCSQRFRTQSGRTKHVRSHHINHNIVQPTPRFPDNNHGQPLNDPLSPSPSPPPFSRPVSPEPSPPSPEPVPRTFRHYHPHLTARPCDSDGNFLPPDTAPSPRSNEDPNSWAPFEDEAQFRVADLLFRKVEMSGANIDELMDIWAQSKGDDDDWAPFDSHQHMYNVVDSIPHGDAPWKSFTCSYTGTISPDPPSWQMKDYEVWYRDPSTVIQNLLDNPDFDGMFDYTPFVEVDEKNHRCWNEFMSANFAWRHAVSFDRNFIVSASDG